MIIARSPLRVSLGGGGTDLPSYSNEHEGFLIAGAIDRYVYVNINHPFNSGFHLKYSHMESVTELSEINHPIIREALQLLNDDFNYDRLEITTVADIPSGTGLGSSGSFTTALIKALYAHQNLNVTPNSLAEIACKIEIEKLKEPIGKQDQYIAAFGGLTTFTFHKNGAVSSKPLNITKELILELEESLLLFYTGMSRSAGSILQDQDSRSKNNDLQIINNLHEVKEMGYESRELLESGQLTAFGMLMHKHWERKKKRSSNMSNSAIDNYYAVGIKNGAIGGKLVGAGGGGFILFLAHDRTKLRKAMFAEGLQEARFRFDFEGTKLISVR